MKAIVLDFHEFDTAREAHAYLAEHLDFPAYYGHNLDALYDCLTELSEDVCVTVVESGKAFERGFEQVFLDAAEDGRHFFCTGFTAS